MGHLIDGRLVSEKLLCGIALEKETLKQKTGRTPHLAVVIVGNNPASIAYVNAKAEACKKTGFSCTIKRFAETVTEKELLEYIESLNKNHEIDGFIVQLPLPSHIRSEKITEAISPEKDVDGFHPVNIGKMMLNKPCFIPATPYGIMLLLEHYKIDTAGKHCVVAGRSNIVGMPMSILMARKAYPGNCTVTVCHSNTKDIAGFMRNADILIAALGQPEFVTAGMVKEGAVVVDVGITRVVDKTKKSGYRLAGDVKFDEVAPKCSYITPVPGGVGPMTIAGLLKNTLQAARF